MYTRVQRALPASRSARVSALMGDCANGDVISCDGGSTGRLTHAPGCGGGVGGGKGAPAAAIARWRPPNGDSEAVRGDAAAGDERAAVAPPAGGKPRPPCRGGGPCDDDPCWNRR